MIELNDLYDYGLKIYQNKDYFKFSLDSLLLAEFANIKDNERVLDMCTGNAPIPLIITTKVNNAKIDAVEIQKPIYDLAKKSIKENGLENSITIYNIDIKEYRPNVKYDVVICNPPYFKSDEGRLHNDDLIKSIARHEIKITLSEVIGCASSFLSEKGRFYMVQRTERFLDTIEYLKERKLGIRKVAFINTKRGKSAEFFLIEASKNKKNDLKVQNVCIEGLLTYQNIFKEG